MPKILEKLKISQERKTLNKIKIKNPECLNIKVQFYRNMTNKYTVFWREGNLGQFAQESLINFIKGLKGLKESRILSIFKREILPKLQSYLSFFSEDNASLFNNSIVSGILCVSQENQDKDKDKRFYLESTKEFIVLLAIYRAVIKHC